MQLRLCCCFFSCLSVLSLVNALSKPSAQTYNGVVLILIGMRMAAGMPSSH